MRWLTETPIICFDTETTGVDVENDRIVTACIALINPGQPPTVTTWTINPGIPIPAEATAIHGITNSHVQAHGAEPAVALDQIAAVLDDGARNNLPIIAYNAAFDLTILDRECRRHNLPTPGFLTPANTPYATVVDPYVIDKHIDPYRKGSRKLTHVATHYAVRLDGAHDAAFDALAAARIAWRLATMTSWTHQRLTSHYAHPDLATHYSHRHNPTDIANRVAALATLTPHQLHRAQTRWRADQQRGLREHLHREHKPADDVREEWPVIPAAPG